MGIGIDGSLKSAPLQADMASQDAALKSALRQAKALTKTQGETAKDVKTRAQIRKLSEDFEAIFMQIVLKSMRDTIPKSSFIDGGNAEDIYRSMLDSEYAKLMAGQRNTGLADNIEDFLLQGAGLTKQNALPKSVLAANAPLKAMGLKAYGAEGLHNSAKQVKIDGDRLDLKKPR